MEGLLEWVSTLRDKTEWSSRYSLELTFLLAYFIGIRHVLNEQGTGYQYSLSIELTDEARHLKEHPKFSKCAKLESFWFKNR